MLIKLSSDFTHNTCLLPREMIETISCTVFDTWLTNKAWVKVHTGRLFLCILSCSYFSFHSAIHSSHTDFLLSLSVSCDISWSNIQQQSDTPTCFFSMILEHIHFHITAQSFQVHQLHNFTILSRVISRRHQHHHQCLNSIGGWRPDGCTGD